MEGLGSPWAVLAKGKHAELRYLAGSCDWVEGRKGITTDLNGVYFVPIEDKSNDRVKIRSRPEAGKKDIGPLQKAWVEPDLLYPLVKGAADFEPCYLRLSSPKYNKETLYTFVPNEGISNADYEATRVAMNSPAQASTKKWFSGFKAHLERRSTFRRQMKGAPYFAIYNVGEYTFQPWKVVWPEMSTTFKAAVAGSANVPLVGERPYVPDHKVYFAGFDEKEPAYFLCGLLNAPSVREWLESHILSIQMGNVFKHLRLPEYDSGNEAHAELSALVEANA